MQPAASLCIMFLSVSICSLLAVGGIAIIALGSSGVFTSHKSSGTTTTSAASTTAIASTTSTVISTTTTTTTTTTRTTVNSSVTSNTVITTSSLLSVSVMNDVLVYPNGSYLAALSSFTQASDTFALTAVNQSLLNMISRVDNSSVIIEAGRVQYLYFHVPTGKSSSTSRSMSVRSAEQKVKRVKSVTKRAGSNVITGIAIHFGAIGSGSSVVVVLLPTIGSTNNTIPGVATLYTLSDGSIIIRIEISVPSSLCPSSNGQSIAACLQLSYQAYSIVNNNQITSALFVDVQTACGDVCSLPAGLCSASCTTCEGLQVAGADTPVTRRYDMGATKGSFQFDYNTYFIKDRITVWNAGMLVFDTGCVGAFDTVQLNYTSSSPSIRISVEPNCACLDPAGCSGTAWDFTVHCLNATTS